MRPRRDSLAAAAGYVAATILFTWPLARHAGTHFAAVRHPTTHNDTLLSAWIVSWDIHQLLRSPLDLFDANILYPLHHTLAYSVAYLSNALLVLPLAPLTPNPALVYNATVLLTFFVGAFGTFLLVRHLVRDPLAAFLAGLIFAFCPFRFWQIGRLNVLSVQWTPFVFLALHRYLEIGGWRRAALLALAFALQALATVYGAFSTAVLLAVFLGAWLLLERRSWPRVLGAGVALLSATALVAIVYSPYAMARAEMALGRDPSQLILHSVVPAEIGHAVVNIPSYLYLKLTQGARGAGTLGVMAAVLMWIGILRGNRTVRLYALLALVALLLSFGPVIVWGRESWMAGPYSLLYEYVPGFSAMREPRRFTAFVVANGAVLAGAGAAYVFQRWRSHRTLLAIAIAVVIVFEVGWQPLPLMPAPLPGERRVLYDALTADRRPGAVVELPMGGDRKQAVATFDSTYHFRPLLNGYSGFSPTIADLRRRLRSFPDDDSVALLRGLGVRWVVYDSSHPGALSADELGRRLHEAHPASRILATAGDAVLAELAFLEPASAPRPGGWELPRSGWRVRASAGEPQNAIDDDLATHWVASVDPDTGGGWIEVDLGTPTEIGGVALDLATHYGEYPRAWRVTVLDGDGTSQVTEDFFAAAPLRSYRADRRRIVFDFDLPPTRGQRVRIEVPPLRKTVHQKIAPEHRLWWRWGAHEIRIYAPAPRNGQATS